MGGVCLVKKERPLLGGFFLGYSTLLRIFPLFIFSGPILVIVRQIWGAPSPDRPWWKPEPWDSWRALAARVDRRFVSILAGAALAVAILVPISLVTSNGIAGYRAFAFNTAEAQGDAAHQLHGPAHHRRLLAVGSGAGDEGRSVRRIPGGPGSARSS